MMAGYNDLIKTTARQRQKIARVTTALMLINCDLEFENIISEDDAVDIIARIDKIGRNLVKDMDDDILRYLHAPADAVRFIVEGNADA